MMAVVVTIAAAGVILGVVVDSIEYSYQRYIDKSIFSSFVRAAEIIERERKRNVVSSTLPKLVLSLTHNFDAWIVGSAADPANTNPRDYDIIVPFSQWGPASQLIPRDAVPNTFGGWKCQSDGKEVDVWPGELGWLMTKPKAKYVWHPASDTRYVKATAVLPPSGCFSSRPVDPDDFLEDPEITNGID